MRASRVCFFITFVVFLASIVLSLVSVLETPWTSFRTNGQVEEFSLMGCDSNKQDKNFSCLKYSCTGNECEFASDLNRMRWISFASENISMIFLALLAQNALLLAMDHKHGEPRSIYVQLLITFVARVASLISVIFVGKVNLNLDCDRDREICGEVGSLLVFINTVLVIVAEIVFLVNFLRRKADLEDNNTGKNKFKCVFLQNLALVLVSMGFKFISLSLNWISYRASSERSGSLLFMNKFDTYTDIEYICLSDIYKSSVEGEAMETAWKHGKCMLYVLVFTQILLALWIEALVHHVLNKDKGIPVLEHIWAWSCSLLYLIGLLVYFNVYSLDCSYKPQDNQVHFCVEKGYIFSFIALTGLMISAFVTSILIQWKKNNKKEALPQRIFSADPDIQIMRKP